MQNIIPFGFSLHLETGRVFKVDSTLIRALESLHVSLGVFQGDARGSELFFISKFETIRQDCISYLCFLSFYLVFNVYSVQLGGSNVVSYMLFSIL